MLKINVMLILALFMFCGIANGKVLFVDNFENDAVGSEPANWEKLVSSAGNSTIII